MYLIYSVLYSIALLFLLPFEYLKRAGELRSRWFRERFGFFTAELRTSDPKRIWIHAVSVGEVISAVPFVRELKRRYPAIPVVFSTVTDTGQAVARERISDIAQIVYLPFDLVHIVRRVLRKLRPSLFIILETELWPNIFRTFKQEGIPVLVLNGRISGDSFKGYRRIKFFIRDVLACVDLFCMQDRVYEERIRELGVEAKRVRVTGNFKFDTKPSEKIPEWTNALGHPVMLAGSTHEGEEELMLSVFERLRNDFPGMNLLLAPRRPERFEKVEGMVHARNLPCLKRSEIGTVNAEHGAIRDKVVILDTIGELASCYAISDIAVMGGSFFKVGGHNPLEPSFWGKPVVCGPHMENFPFIQDFYIGSGAIKTDAEGLCEVVRELFRSPAKRKAMGGRAKALYGEKAGAVDKALDALKSYLDPQLSLSKEKPLS
jgi:3-deoxy-D-manno-octulosonic-acid transferase